MPEIGQSLERMIQRIAGQEAAADEPRASVEQVLGGLLVRPA